MPRRLRSSPSPFHVVRHGLAFLFAAIATVYSLVWMLHVRYAPAQPGLGTYEYLPNEHCIRVNAVVDGSPAAKAGLLPGDKIVAIDGRRLENLRPFYEALIVGNNENVELTVRDAEAPSGVRQLKMVIEGRRHAPSATERFDIWRANGRIEELLGFPIGYYPLGFLLVGSGVLLLRPEDRNAWLLALVFGGFLAGGPLFEALLPERFRGFEVAYKMILSWPFSSAIFYYFFAVFPAPSPLDRKVPWLKYLLVGGALIVTVPLGLQSLIDGGSLPLYLDLHWPGIGTLTWGFVAQTGFPVPISRGWLSPEFVFFGSFFGTTILGLASLISNNFLAPDAQTRRKAHVMLWGTILSVTPLILAVGTAILRGPAAVPLIEWQACAIALSFVLPITFAYAVLKHRVLEIPMLLKRSVRYLLVQRGFAILLLILWLFAIRLFTFVLSDLVGSFSNVVMILGLLFGVGLVWIAAPLVRRVTERIDRAFFRSAHDTRRILESLVEETRTVTSRQELGVLLGGEIKQALHPVSVAVYLADKDGRLRVFPDSAATRLPPLPSELPLLHELAERKKPWQAADGDGTAEEIKDELLVFSPTHPECIVPLLTRGGGLTGLLVLGARLSEEPYSGEDERLLNAVAAQAGGTLENMRLAEEMAERMETERRISRDMEIAKQVQARLFPQKLPALCSLDYAGRCIQARDVGGDYYDFLNLGAGRMGIVLADIVGKGISGALLMANLQANVRSQCAIASQNLLQYLQSVNQAFFESTDEGSYATLFFGDYEESSRRLRFANCGHNPPFLVRASGLVERLEATATVLGLFEKWDCSVAEVQIVPGDVLVIYTDGITEANNSEGEEFGGERLEKVIRENVTAPVEAILDAILAATLKFSGAEMRDDLTLVVARGR